MINKKDIIFTLFICTMFLTRTAWSEMRPVKKIRAGIPPFEVIEKVVRTNDKMMVKKEAIEEKEITPATPFLAWVTDTDPEIEAAMLIDDPNKSRLIYQIRTPGGQIELAQGSIDYGIWQLHAPVLLITGNTASHALHLFMQGYKHLSVENQKALDGLKIPLKHDNKDEDFSLRLRKNVEAGIDYQINLAMERYQERIADGRLTVVGSVLDLANLYGRGAGRHLIIRVNNEKEPARIKEMPIMSRLDPRLLERNIGRDVKMKGEKN
ncbi:MAG: hypothetical protein KKB30_06870 [Proteobacteria bacterium]|nr:hypothetical protein [Pseudomonadota bacterium]MBU1715439.1 hypothetical protein [Pseudomonadota bacterium]